MSGFVQVNVDAEFCLAPGQKLIKESDYLQYRSASDMLSHAQKNVKKMEDKAKVAYEEFEVVGYEKGLEQANTDAIQRMVKNVERGSDYLKQIEQSLVDVVVASVRDILGDFDDVEIARRVVKKMSAQVYERQHLTLRVDAESFMQVSKALEGSQQEFPQLKIVSDRQLPRNGFILESPTEIIDGSIDNQVDILMRSLEGSMRSIKVE
jgi:type III secretion system HrpE/YscL family protein